MSRIDMDGVFSTNHKALDLIPLDLIPVSRTEAMQILFQKRRFRELQYPLRIAATC